MNRTALIAATSLMIAQAGCSGGKPAPEDTSSSEATLPVAEPSATASEEPAEEAQSVRDTSIPEPLRGRWGLVTADCTSTKGDAKGLLTIGADQLKFYESVARLDTIKSIGPQSVTATFNFSGEGQSWVLDVALSSPDDGKTLLRKDTGPDAAPASLTYTRCP